MATSLTVLSTGRERFLRVTGVAVLCLAVVVLFVGLVVVISGIWVGMVAVLAGVVSLWGGTIATWQRVYIGQKRVWMASPWPRSAQMIDVAAIDIRRHDFGMAKQVVPFVTLNNGRSFGLLPLAVSPFVLRSVPTTPQQWRARLAQQRAAVDELRSKLGVGGSNYYGD